MESSAVIVLSPLNVRGAISELYSNYNGYCSILVCLNLFKHTGKTEEK